MMTHAQPLAALAAHPDFAQNASFIIVGFVFVIVMLGALASVTTLVGSFFKRKDKKEAEAKLIASQAQAASTAPAPADPVTTAPLEIDEMKANPHLIPLITAAVHTVIGNQPHRIVGIQTVQAGWAAEGRRQIFSSHRVR